ncbi:MAG: histidine--tRNA ligase [bacterium]|nr:histidine--tRNA ligase [bacterium]
MKTQTLKGFRDFLPEQARKRQYVIDTLRKVFESYGFEPLETPALEYEEVLMGKYGEEGNKLMYRFTDNGGRRVALRYDQTVPLARVIAQYPDLPKPFKRYQIQPMWRAENPQKGRYREATQCDIDTVGTSSPIADAEIIACAIDAAKKLGFKNLVMNINDRCVFGETKTTYLITLDKLAKIGQEATAKELVAKGMSQKEAKEFIENSKNKTPTPNLQKVFSYLKEMGFEKDKDFAFNPLIVRGLDYYTSTVFELIDSENPSLTIAGGGRYDKMIGVFTGAEIPAVGISFGLERVVEAIDDTLLFPQEALSPAPQALVTIFSKELTLQSIKAASLLRDGGVNTELYPDEEAKLDKQLKYANKRGIPFVVIVGSEEAKASTATLKNMETGEQKTVPQDKLVDTLQG